LSKETLFITIDTLRIKVKEWKNTYQESGSQKQAGTAILVVDKAHFKQKLVRRDKEGYYILKGTIHQF
jgi:hypothetical protein